VERGLSSTPAKGTAVARPAWGNFIITGSAYHVNHNGCNQNELAFQHPFPQFNDLEGYHNAGLSPVEVHMMDYASKISGDVNSVTQADLDLLRQDGLSDQQITDIALVTVARNFTSRFFGALGATSDLELQQQEPELWEYLKDWQKEY
jgi:hypothetical protein